MTYKCINSNLCSHPMSCALCLSEYSGSNTLKVQRNNLKISNCAFSVCAPKLCNQLSNQLKDLTCFTKHKRD